jgi:hypothetical protein
MLKKDEPIMKTKTKTKYVLEDGSEVSLNMKDMNEMVEEEEKDGKTNLCLISGEKITEPSVKLDCGHTYNYIPLYKDVINQKKKFWGLDTDKLNMNEMRCPYCRKKQNKLLSFYDLPEVEKIHGINWLDETLLTTTYNHGVCEYKCENPNTFYCLNNYVIKLSNGKTYCCIHQKTMLKQIAKEKAKEEKAKEKEAAKKTLLEKKIQQKQNIILCQTILKTGKRIGKPCGQKAIQENCCLRHYHLQNI